MIEENPRDVGHEMDELSIVYGDESLPRLYENSRISSDQLTGQSGGHFLPVHCLPYLLELLVNSVFCCAARNC